MWSRYAVSIPFCAFFKRVMLRGGLLHTDSTETVFSSKLTSSTTSVPEAFLSPCLLHRRLQRSPPRCRLRRLQGKRAARLCNNLTHRLVFSHGQRCVFRFFFCGFWCAHSSSSVVAHAVLLNLICGPSNQSAPYAQVSQSARWLSDLITSLTRLHLT